MLKIFNSVAESDEFSSRDNWNGFSAVSNPNKYTESGSSTFNYTFFKRSKYLDKNATKLADSNAPIELPKIRHSFIHLIKYDRYDPAKSRFLHCDLCTQLIFDSASKENFSCFRCTECGMVVHPSCVPSVPASCYPPTDLYWWSHVPRGSLDNQKKCEPNFEKMDMVSPPGTDTTELLKVWFTHSDKSMVATDYTGRGYGITIAPPPSVNPHLGIVLEEPHLVDPIGPPLTEKLVRDVCFGAAHTIFLCTDGALYSIGRNYEGQLGLGSDVENSPQPRLIIDLASKVVTKISCGGNHNIALTQDNEIYVWGDGRNGRLGDGTDETKFKPTKLKLPVDQIKQVQGFLAPGKMDTANYPIRIVRCGWSHTMVVVESPPFLDIAGNTVSLSYLFTFGRGQWGQCGHSVTRDENRPKLVEFFKNMHITDISGGYYHTAVIANEYEICQSQTSDNSIRTSRERKNSSPEISAKLIARGRVYCFGYGGEGQCGQGPDNLQHQLSPQLVRYLADQEVTSLSCGGFHTIALVSPPVVATSPTNITRPTSLAYFWGGINGDTVSIPKVIPQLADKNVISIRTAMFQSLAVCVHTPIMTSSNVIPASPAPVREPQPVRPKETEKAPLTPKGSARDFYRSKAETPNMKRTAARDMTNSVVTPMTPHTPPSPSVHSAVPNPHLISPSQYLLYRVLHTTALKKPLELEIGSLSVKIDDYLKTAQQKKIQQEKLRLAQLRLEQRKRQHEQSLSRLQAEKEKAQKLRETCQLRKFLLDQSVQLLQTNKTNISSQAALLFEDYRTIQLKNEAIEVYRNKLLQYISQIFPIERISNVEYSICDLVLPNLDNLDKLFLEAGNFLKDPYNFKKYDKEMIANAIGYVIQLLEIVSKYIEFPFIYDMRFLGSRSCIMDPVTTDNIQIFPLYVPQKIEHFNYALTLLHQNLDQVLRCRGIDCLNLGWTLPNVQKLLLGENATIPLKQDKESEEHKNTDNNNHPPKSTRKASAGEHSSVKYTVNFQSPALVMPQSPQNSSNNISLKNSPK